MYDIDNIIYIYIYIYISLTASLQRGKTPPPNACSGYDTKQSYGEVPVMLELGECKVPPHCHCSQLHSGFEW